MAKQTINIGAAANDGTGDPIRTAFDKSNGNFDELYAADAAARSIATGGTGATDAAGARTNLDVYSTAEVDAAVAGAGGGGGGGGGDMLAANNLSDVADVATARDNLDVYSTAEVDAAVAAGGGGGGGGSGTAPTIRGSNIGTTTGTTVAITLPAGSAAGDTAIIIAISGNPVYPPSGTELIDEVSDSTSNFAVYTRVLDASDITTGSLTVTTSTAFFMVATIVVIQGAVGHVEMNKRLMQIGAKPTPFQNRKIRSNLFYANDLCLLSLSCRGSASTNTSDLGTLQQTSANSNGSQAVYSIPVASDGAIVPTVNIPNTGSFDMRVMFVTVRGV